MSASSGGGMLSAAHNVRAYSASSSHLPLVASDLATMQAVGFYSVARLCCCDVEDCCRVYS
jgi:hypothetical protein